MPECLWWYRVCISRPARRCKETQLSVCFRDVGANLSLWVSHDPPSPWYSIASSEAWLCNLTCASILVANLTLIDDAQSRVACTNQGSKDGDFAVYCA